MTQIHPPVTYGATAGAWSRSISGIVAAGGGVLAGATFSTAHGLSDDCHVTIAGVTGVTALNATWTVRVVDSVTVDLVDTGAISGSPGGSITATLATVDISGEAHPDPTVCVCVEALASGKSAVIAIEDSVDSFSNSVPRYLFNLEGPITAAVTLKKSRRDNPMNRFGTASALLRARVLSVDSAAGLQFSAWIED